MSDLSRFSKWYHGNTPGTALDSLAAELFVSARKSDYLIPGNAWIALQRRLKEHYGQ